MNIKAKVISVTLVVLTAVIAVACSREINLPVLYKAPDFTLTNQNSQEVKLSDFRGEVVVLNFFYSRCPDICGEENYRLQGMWQQLNVDSRKDLDFISISFDPYDTSEILRQYATFFDVPGWQFLTGTDEQIKQVTAAYWVGYEPEEGSSNITHSVSIVLIDRDGMVRKTYGTPEFPVKDVASELEYLLE